MLNFGTLCGTFCIGLIVPAYVAREAFVVFVLSLSLSLFLIYVGQCSIADYRIQWPPYFEGCLEFFALFQIYLFV